jgi:TPR repeat protein
MSIYEDANNAFERGELIRVRELLAPGAVSGDPDAQAALGSFLTLTSDPRPFREGVEWLRSAADAGDGVAAHNLATILLSGGPGVDADCEEAMRYLARARESGFEASLSFDAE